MMREIEINIKDVKSPAEFHEIVREKMNFPDYYGKNLDAMHDCLTDIMEPMEVTFFGVKSCRESSAEMSQYIDSLENMLNDVSAEMENLTFILIAEDSEDNLERAIEMDSEFTCERNAESICNKLGELGVGEGDLVVISGFSGPEVLEGVKMLGAEFLPIDVSPENYAMEPRLIDFALEELTPKAIILSSLFGIKANNDVISQIADERGLAVVYEEAKVAPEDSEYFSRIGDAYKLAIQLRFGKGTTKIWTPKLPDGMRPSWQGFPVRFSNNETRENVYNYLKERGIEVMLPLTGLGAEEMSEMPVAKKLLETALVLPTGANMDAKSIVSVVDGIWEYFGKPKPEEDLNPFSGITGSHPEYGTR